MDEWYTADSDSEDYATAMREDGLEEGFDGEEDPTCPPIYFTATGEREYCRKLRSALIVKPLGRIVSYTAVSIRLNTIWGKAGGIQVTSMKNGYFLVRFTSGMDYDRAVTNGPWMIGPNYLSVHMWDKNFDPYNHEISSTLVWARLLDILIHYFHQEAMMKIGRRIGRPIRIDEATRTAARSDYARVCVQVDLTRPLLSKFSIRGKKYFIQYEGLENICLNCGTYAEKWGCSCVKSQAPMEAEHTVQEPTPAANQNEPLYGEWMIAKRKPRTQKKDQGANVSLKGTKTTHDTHQHAGGSRFAALEEEDIILPGSEHADTPNVTTNRPHQQSGSSRSKNKIPKQTPPVSQEKESMRSREPRAAVSIGNNNKEATGKERETQTVNSKTGTTAGQPNQEVMEPPFRAQSKKVETAALGRR
ncbi:unnamed protein product [Linum trigynum]|uniref:DUF4283 domain-containing protein n=1 Tax=Linum trigynum TaxID=586398 RepID=A0AAV2GI41_9ROSI